MTETTNLTQTQMRLFIASDHGGWALKEHLKARFPLVEWVDLGPETETPSVDYPDFADRVCQQITPENTSPQGILLCGSGQGMAMRANKYPSIRAALVWSEETARLARAHNNANVLCLGGRVLSHELATQCLRIFLETPFEGGRHTGRIEKLQAPLVGPSLPPRPPST